MLEVISNVVRHISSGLEAVDYFSTSIYNFLFYLFDFMNYSVAEKEYF